MEMDKILETYANSPETLYGDTFFKKCGKSRSFQNEFAKVISKSYDIKSVLDMGCACGWYLEGFNSVGVEVKGIEYVYDVAKKYFPKEIEDRIVFGDLTKEIDFKNKFDLVISLEVAEHLPPGSDEVYIQNLTRHATQKILFSVAESEDGNYHINLKPRQYWLDLMERNGFVYSEKETQYIRSVYRTIPIGNPYKRYLSKTAFMLVRK